MDLLGTENKGKIDLSRSCKEEASIFLVWRVASNTIKKNLLSFFMIFGALTQYSTKLKEGILMIFLAFFYSCAQWQMYFLRELFIPSRPYKITDLFHGSAFKGDFQTVCS